MAHDEVRLLSLPFLSPPSTPSTPHLNIPHRIVATKPSHEKPLYNVLTLIDFPDRKTCDECLADTEAELVPDIPNYSNQQPIFLIGEPFGGDVGGFGKSLWGTLGGLQPQK